MSKIGITIDGQAFEIEVNLFRPGSRDLTVTVDGEELPVAVSSLEGPEHIEWVLVGNRPYEVVIDPNLRWIRAYNGLHWLEMRDLEAAVPRPVSADGRVKAPIPGLITRVLVRPGDRVEVGQSLLILEAMKMENEILAPRAGTVSVLNVQAGQTVALGQVLAEIS